MDWKRDGLPDAKFEVTGAKCDLRNEQQREKREESRERREQRGPNVRVLNNSNSTDRVCHESSG